MTHLLEIALTFPHLVRGETLSSGHVSDQLQHDPGAKYANRDEADAVEPIFKTSVLTSRAWGTVRHGVDFTPRFFWVAVFPK